MGPGEPVDRWGSISGSRRLSAAVSEEAGGGERVGAGVDADGAGLLVLSGKQRELLIEIRQLLTEPGTCGVGVGASWVGV